MLSQYTKPTFLKNIIEMYGASGQEWLVTLPHFIDHLSSKWHIQLVDVLPNLSYSFVARVWISSGCNAILKIAPEGPRTYSEFKWLTTIGQGVPAVYQFDEKLNAILMESLEPGFTLKKCVQEGQDDKATRIICETIRALQSKQTMTTSFKHLSELKSSFACLHQYFDARLLAKAEALFDTLTTNRERDVILHGDLHHDNILFAGNQWKVIDPHGYLGHPAAEVGAMIRNPYDCFPTDRPLEKVLQRRFDILCDELPFDPYDIYAWIFCMTVLSSAWTVEDFGKLDASDIELAAAIEKIKV